MQEIKALFLQIRAEYQEFTRALTPALLLVAARAEFGLGDPHMQPSSFGVEGRLRLRGSRSRAD